MKIGMVGRFGEQEGISIYSDSLAEGLEQNKIQVVRIGGIKSKADYRTELKAWKLRESLRGIAQKESLDIIHMQYISERSYYGMRSLNLNFIRALKQPVPVAVTMHEIHYSASGIRQLIVKKLEETIIRRASAAIVHTKGQAEYIRKAYGINADSIHHGLVLNPTHKKKGNSRGKNLLFFGLISEAKGLEYLIAAMKQLRDYKLTIAGRPVSGQHLKKLQASVMSPNIKADFGWATEEKKREYFSNADIAVLPYLEAPYQSGVLHNAMSYGIPVVATRVGALWEIIEEFKCGETVEMANSTAIAEAVRKVEKNYQTYQQGVMRYRKEANWDAVAKRHIKLYIQLLEKTHTPMTPE
ncbi:glycosyltransferase [Candidatus Woesearchaeota archaeon]|nr:glycosyltransferase [Candidatus Woesearchaeota archaeon]